MSSTPSTPRPYLDEQGRTDAEVYLTDIYDGKIVACKYMKQFADIMLPRISDGYKEWHFDVDKALRPVKFIEKFCRIPASKNAGMPFILYPYERMPIELAFGFVGDDGYRQIRQVIIEWARKNGKALALDTEIPTPDGWRLMKDIHPGDYVFGQDGRPSKVLVESEIFDKPMYLVTFEDGSEIRASEDHVWTVREDDGEWRDMTTAELIEAFAASIRSGTDWEVPLPKPVEYPERDLPYDPMGIGRMCVQHGYEVPEEYVLASVGQRRQLLEGMLRECGYRPYDGPDWVCLRTDDHVAISQIAELASSLGIPCSMNEGDLGSMSMFMPLDGERVDGKRIRSMELIPNEPSKCIAIDNESHLYLAGRGYTAVRGWTS